MKRFTVTLEDELEKALEEYLSPQKPAPSLTALVQDALREYLLQAKLRQVQYRPQTLAASRRGPGERFIRCEPPT